MPTVVSTFPPARNHARAEELIAATDFFVLDRWPFESQQERDFFVSCDYASFITKIIPDGEFEGMVWGCRASTLLFLTDDWIERQPQGKGAGLVDRIAGIIRGEVVPRVGLAVEEMLNQIFRAIEASTGAEQYRQMSHLTCECLRNQGSGPNRNIEEYLDFRCYNSGGYFALALIRYALDIYLTDEQLQNPLLATCERLALEAISMENDVMSYEKEMQQNTLANNLVAMLLQHGVDGLYFGSASAAKDHILGRVADCETKLEQAIAVARADKVFGKSDTIRKWLHALPYLVSGSTWWSQTVRNVCHQRSQLMLVLTRRDDTICRANLCRAE
ncbi:isoprenoid synthase domain-containing protein [Mycena capillaripes]|nr:isoprenoid synthase domain-containing protein [Mycena capillaripes]